MLQCTITDFLLNLSSVTQQQITEISKIEVIFHFHNYLFLFRFVDKQIVHSVCKKEMYYFNAVALQI